jgi:hypothetical protein
MFEIELKVNVGFIKYELIFILQRIFVTYIC